MRISVFGLGYVGCVSAACFAREGFDVLGVDVSRDKVALINAGRATIVEDGVAELVEAVVSNGSLKATTDARSAVLDTHISLICVGTPSRPNGDINLDYVSRVCEQIGEALRDKDQHHTVVIRSTVLPGTIDRVVIPTLEGASGKQLDEGFSVCSNPEFLREGTSIKDFYDPPFTLIGSTGSEGAARLSEIYRGVQAEILHTSIPVAETIKYVCNCFHGMKVAFANEIGNICKSMGIDSHQVMRVVCEDTKLNISAAYLKPGFAFGGSCLPKDLRALIYRAKQLDLDSPVLSSILAANAKQIQRGVDMVLATGSRRVGILGMAFKAGTDDLRESPIVTMIEQLIGKGVEIAIYDRLVSEANVIGSNRSFVESEIPHIWSLVRGSVEDVLQHSEVLVVGNQAPEFADVLESLREDQVVIDLVRVDASRISDDSYQGLCW